MGKKSNEIRRNNVKGGKTRTGECSGSDHMEYTEVTGENECRLERMKDIQNKL